VALTSSFMEIRRDGSKDALSSTAMEESSVLGGLGSARAWTRTPAWTRPRAWTRPPAWVRSQLFLFSLQTTNNIAKRIVMNKKLAEAATIAWIDFSILKETKKERKELEFEKERGG
jgi:hypothetical protein